MRNAHVVHTRVSEAKRSKYICAVAQWRMARTYADLALVDPVRLRVPGHLPHLGGGNGPPGASGEEMLPTPAIPAELPWANVDAIVVLRSWIRTASRCVDWSLHIPVDPQDHLLEVPSKESPSLRRCTRLRRQNESMLSRTLPALE